MVEIWRWLRWIPIWREPEPEMTSSAILSQLKMDAPNWLVLHNVAYHRRKILFVNNLTLKWWNNNMSWQWYVFVLIYKFYYKIIDMLRDSNIFWCKSNIITSTVYWRKPNIWIIYRLYWECRVTLADFEYPEPQNRKWSLPPCMTSNIDHWRNVFLSITFRKHSQFERILKQIKYIDYQFIVLYKHNRTRWYRICRASKPEMKSSGILDLSDMAAGVMYLCS